MLDSTCPSGRVCFPSWNEAMRSAKFIKQHGKAKNSGTPRRPYRCETCRWYHLTSWVSQGDWWTK